MVGLDERPATVAFFSEIAAGYVAEPFTVELLPVAAGVRGVVFRDGATWRIIADEAAPARYLFRVLLHELGHVVRGDIKRVSALLLEHIHGAVLGDTGTWPAALREVLEAEHDEAKHEYEAEINAWAEKLEAEHWPALRRRLDEQYREYIRGGWLSWQRIKSTN